MRIFKIVYFVLTFILVFSYGSPKFGDKIKKSDQNNTLTEVVIRAQPTQPKLIETSFFNNPNERSINDHNNNNNNKDYANGQVFHFKYSSAHNHNNDNNANGFSLKEPQLQHRTGFATHERQQQNEPQFDSPDSSPFDFGFPQASASGHYDQPIFEGPPAPPSPPPPPEQPKIGGFNSPQFQYQQTNYDNDDDHNHHREVQHYYPSQPQHSYGDNAIKHDPQFSFNFPQGFPLPKNDARANFKKELMGSQNTKGKPWGAKMSYTYRDPKNPNNYMEVSEVRMSMNKQMDPEEAATQVQKFLALAQNGNYGPIRSHDNYNNYQSDHERVDPPEPSEPKFADF